MMRMTMEVMRFLSELERKGVAHDFHAVAKVNKYLNITKDTGEFLRLFLSSAHANNVLEIGTSNGYSTIWLALGIPEGGHVVTIDSNSSKIEEAERNFKLAGVDNKISSVLADSSDYLRKSKASYDFIFLDGDRNTYLPAINDILRLLACGGVIVCDNAVSHKDELAPFMDYFERSHEYMTSLIPIGKGEFIIHKPKQ